jgi:hypothetical protein
MSDSDEIDSIDSAEVVVKKKRKKRKKNKDPNRPKRNMSAFFLYSNANRARVKADNPDAKFGDIVSRRYFEFCMFCAMFGQLLGVTGSCRVEDGAVGDDGAPACLDCMGRLGDPIWDEVTLQCAR